MLFVVYCRLSIAPNRKYEIALSHLLNKARILLVVALKYSYEYKLEHADGSLRTGDAAQVAHTGLRGHSAADRARLGRRSHALAAAAVRSARPAAPPPPASLRATRAERRHVCSTLGNICF